MEAHKLADITAQMLEGSALLDKDTSIEMPNIYGTEVLVTTEGKLFKITVEEVEPTVAKMDVFQDDADRTNVFVK